MNTRSVIRRATSTSSRYCPDEAVSTALVPSEAFGQPHEPEAAGAGRRAGMGERRPGEPPDRSRPGKTASTISACPSSIPTLKVASAVGSRSPDQLSEPANPSPCSSHDGEPVAGVAAQGGLGRDVGDRQRDQRLHDLLPPPARDARRRIRRCRTRRVGGSGRRSCGRRPRRRRRRRRSGSHRRRRRSPRTCSSGAGACGRACHAMPRRRARRRPRTRPSRKTCTRGNT